MSKIIIEREKLAKYLMDEYDECYEWEDKGKDVARMRELWREEADKFIARQSEFLRGEEKITKKDCGCGWAIQCPENHIMEEEK
jgi:hypothetical protein